MFAVSLLIGVFIDQNVSALPWPRWYQPLGGIPAIAHPFWRWMDLTLGLVLVGIIEEVIFRGCMRQFLSRYTDRPGLIILASAIAFGAIHWSAGLSAVFATSLVGAVFMALYLATGSLPAIMLAHFVINFIDFSHLLPATLLTFI